MPNIYIYILWTCHHSACLTWHLCFPAEYPQSHRKDADWWMSILQPKVPCLFFPSDPPLHGQKRRLRDTGWSHKARRSRALGFTRTMSWPACLNRRFWGSPPTNPPGKDSPLQVWLTAKKNCHIPTPVIFPKATENYLASHLRLHSFLRAIHTTQQATPSQTKL